MTIITGVTIIRSNMLSALMKSTSSNPIDTFDVIICIVPEQSPSFF